MCRINARLTVDGLPAAHNINNQHLNIKPIVHVTHEPIGDPLETLKDHTWTRFLFQNPGGISIGAGGDIETVLEHAKAMECDHLVLSETKLNTAMPWVKFKVHNHCRRIFGVGQYRATMAASPLEFPTSYKPGRVFGVTVGHLVGRVIETGSDPTRCEVSWSRNSNQPTVLHAQIQQ